MHYPIQNCTIAQAVDTGDVESIRRAIVGGLVRIAKGLPVTLIDCRVGTIEHIDNKQEFSEWLAYLDWRYPGHAFLTDSDKLLQSAILAHRGESPLNTPELSDELARERSA